jgi:chorismate mutase
MNDPMITAIRGAICVPADTPRDIDQAVCSLFARLLEDNGLQEQDIAFLLVTQTGDLKSRNPAAGLRSGGHCATTPLFCMQELEIEGMLERVIRLMVVTNRPAGKPVPVYMDGAESLRPDLAMHDTAD